MSNWPTCLTCAGCKFRQIEVEQTWNTSMNELITHANKRLHPHISAVYTGIKKPESFSHSGFSLKVARQFPLNTQKKRIEKPTSAAWFFKTPPKFHWFFANVNARSNLAGIIRVFHVVRDLQRNHPTAARDVMRTTRVRSKVERSRACAPLTKTLWDSRFFRACAFRAKNPECYGFFWQCKRYFLFYFGFCQCKWAYRQLHINRRGTTI